MIEVLASSPKRKCRICGGKHRSKGLCNKHYQRLLKHGDPLTVAEGYEDRVKGREVVHSPASCCERCGINFDRSPRHRSTHWCKDCIEVESGVMV